MGRLPTCLMLASLSVTWFAGCSGGAGDADEQSDPWERNAGETGAPVGDSLPVSAYEVAPDAGMAGYDAGVSYSDEELLAMLLAIHDTEMILGRAAQRATDTEIQTLGAEVVGAHDEGRTRALSIDIFPVPNQQAVFYLEAGVTLRATLLGQVPGDAYDDAYLNLQIMLDVVASSQIDTMWLPMVDSPELRAELTATRDAMQARAKRAAAIRSERHPPRSRAPTDAGAIEPSTSDAGTSEPVEPVEPVEEPQIDPANDVAL